VDAGAALKAIEVTAGGARVDVCAATADEIEADPAVRRLADKAQPRRLVAFKAARPLSPGMSLTVTIPAGFSSAEGPRRTEKPDHFDFSTYRPLALARASCGYRSCAPGQAWTLEFDNPLDEDRFDRAWVRIEPEVAAKVIASRHRIVVAPRSRRPAGLDELGR
jgi:hypothetical protein